MYIDNWHTFHLWRLQAFLALHDSLNIGSRLRDSDCPLTFHSCDRQLLKSCFTQMGCCKRLQHCHRYSFNPLQAACTRIRMAARCIVSNWGVSLRICDHTGFPPPSLSTIVSVALAGYEDSSWRTGTVVSVSWRPAVDRRWPLGNTASDCLFMCVSKLCLVTMTSKDRGLCSC